MRDKIVSCLLGATLGVGCVADQELTLETEPAPLLVEPTTRLWPHTGTAPAVIHVCFAAQARTVPGLLSVPGFTPRPGECPGYKDWIVDAIQESWGRVANLSFDARAVASKPLGRCRVPPAHPPACQYIHNLK